MEMTDEELDAEIAKLEALEKSPQLEVDLLRQRSEASSSQPAANNPLNSASKPIRVAKIGRNDPCPCGSGLKWKKCGLINAPEHKG